MNFTQVRLARPRNVPGFLQVESPIRVLAAIGDVHILQGLPYHAA